MLPHLFRMGSSVVVCLFCLWLIWGCNPEVPPETPAPTPTPEPTAPTPTPGPQSPWAKRAGGTESDGGLGISAMSDGSCLVTGNFQGTATFGLGEANQTSLTSAGSFDMFIARYNADGTLAWAKRAGGTDYDYNEKNSALSDGSCLVTGTFTGTVTFAPGEANATSLTSAGGRDLFIARYNSDGTLAWAKRAGGAYVDYGRGISILADGSCLVTGDFNGTATFGLAEANATALTSVGFNDIFIARYNGDGTLAWAKQAGGTNGDSGYDVSVLSDGSCLVTGDFQGSATFGPGEANATALTSEGGGDLFVAKYNPDGTLAWAKRAGGTSGDAGSSIAALSDGSCVVTGEFNGTATFGLGEAKQTALTSDGEGDIVIARYNADGTLAWSKQAGGTSEDVGQGISTLSDGSCLVTGSFTGSATFSPGEANQTSLTSSGAGDIFIAKYSSGGTLSWVKRTGGAGDETGQGISVLTNGSCLVTGSFAGTATFGPGETNATSLTSAGGYDVFVARFNPDGTFTPVP